MTSYVFNGVAIFGDARLARNQMVGSEMGLWMHPLEVIAWKYHKDPVARLDAVLAWLNQRIDHKARMATLRLGHDTRCISLTDSEFNRHCDCDTLRILDESTHSTDRSSRVDIPPGSATLDSEPKPTTEGDLDARQ